MTIHAAARGANIYRAASVGAALAGSAQRQAVRVATCAMRAFTV